MRGNKAGNTVPSKRDAGKLPDQAGGADDS